MKEVKVGATGEIAIADHRPTSARVYAMLRITVHDKPPVLTFQLEGELAGPWVRELDECWQSALKQSRKPRKVCAKPASNRAS